MMPTCPSCGYQGTEDEKMFNSHLAIQNHMLVFCFIVQICGSQTVWEGKKVHIPQFQFVSNVEDLSKNEFLSQWRWSNATNRLSKMHTQVFFTLLPTPVQFENHLCRPQCQRRLPSLRYYGTKLATSRLKASKNRHVQMFQCKGRVLGADTVTVTL